METLARQTTKRYLSPYVFNCVVNDEHLVARVVAEIKNPCHYVFAVEFSNRETVIVTSVEGGWIADKGLKQYEVPIERAMDKF